MICEIRTIYIWKDFKLPLALRCVNIISDEKDGNMEIMMKKLENIL